MANAARQSTPPCQEMCSRQPLGERPRSFARQNLKPKFWGEPTIAPRRACQSAFGGGQKRDRGRFGTGQGGDWLDRVTMSLAHGAAWSLGASHGAVSDRGRRANPPSAGSCPAGHAIQQPDLRAVLRPAGEGIQPDLGLPSTRVDRGPAFDDLECHPSAGPARCPDRRHRRARRPSVARSFRTSIGRLQRFVPDPFASRETCASAPGRLRWCSSTEDLTRSRLKVPRANSVTCSTAFSAPCAARACAVVFSTTRSVFLFSKSADAIGR
jgi:hypothetical protein